MTGLRPKPLLRRGFFRLEDDNAPVPLHTLFESEAHAQFGGDWFLEDFDDVFTRVMDTPFWGTGCNSRTGSRSVAIDRVKCL